MSKDLIKVEDLNKDSGGTSLLVKVLAHLVKLETNETPEDCVEQNPKSVCADILVGDDTGCMLFFAVNEQVEIMKPGCTVKIENFSLEMSTECLRAKVEKWGSITCVEPGLSCQVNTKRNFSILKYDSYTSLSDT